MALAKTVSKSFIYVADKRPVLVFGDEAQAQQFKGAFRGAEIYGNKTHVFLPTPHGLELVCGGQNNGETAYLFHDGSQAKDWFQKLSGYGVMYTEGDHPSRTVYVGEQGHRFGGEPIYPGVA